MIGDHLLTADQSVVRGLFSSREEAAAGDADGTRLRLTIAQKIQNRMHGESLQREKHMSADIFGPNAAETLDAAIFRASYSSK